MKQVETWLARFEEKGLSLYYSFAILFTWIFLRAFIEGVFEIYKAIGFGLFSYQTLLFNLLHLPLFYLVNFLLIVLVTSIICMTEIKQTAKVFASGFFIILLVPIVDLIVSEGMGYHLHYPENIFHVFLNALLPKHVPDSSWGQRLVFLLSCLGVSFYGYLKRKSIIRSIILFILTYAIIVLIGGFPSLLINIITDIPVGEYLIQGGFLLSATQKYVAIFLMLSLLILVFFSLRFNFQDTVLFLKSLRWKRNMYYGGLCLLGFVIGNALFGDAFPNAFKNIFDYFALVALAFVGLLAFQGAAIINDFYDQQADAITRQHNPLVGQERISTKFYLTWGIVLIIYSLLYALCLNFSVFILAITCHLLACVYTIPPVRLKRIPFISTFLIGFTSLLFVIMGMTLFCGEGAFLAFPEKLGLAIVISTSFGFMAKDIKDIRGDREQKVVTLPTLLGKNITAFLIGGSFFIFPLFYGLPVLWIMAFIFCAVAIVYTVVVHRPGDLLYFILLYVYGLVIAVCFTINPAILTSQYHETRDHYTSHLLKRGVEERDKGNFERARSAFQQVLDKEPLLETGYFNAVRNYMEVKRYDSALVLIQEILDKGLNPKRFIYYAGLCRLYQGREQEAFSLIDKAISMGQKDDGALYYYGRLLLKRGQLPIGQRYLKRHIVANPDDEEARAWLEQ